MALATSKPAQATSAVVKPAGRDAGLLKGQANRGKGTAAAAGSQTTSGKTASQKTAVEKFNDYRSTESARLEERRKREYDLKMAQVSNKRLKYEFKLKVAEAERHNADAERQARLKELELQITLAQLTNPNTRVAQVSSVQPTTYTNATLTPVQPRPPLSDVSVYNTQTHASFSSPSFGSFGAEAEGTSMLEGSSGDDWMKSGSDGSSTEDWMKSGSDIFGAVNKENSLNDIYGSQ